jgi:glutamyl/glutaminyl-tRNA synthetase
MLWLLPTIVRLGCKMIKKESVYWQSIFRRYGCRKVRHNLELMVLTETVLLKKILLSKEWKWRFWEGSHVLRAKIDMTSTNMLMRDPLMYRVYTVITTELETIGKSIPCMILHMESDYIEQISHSICTLEFVMHKNYNWFWIKFMMKK